MQYVQENQRCLGMGSTKIMVGFDAMNEPRSMQELCRIACGLAAQSETGLFITSRQVKNADVPIKFGGQSRSSNRRLITGSLQLIWPAMCGNRNSTAIWRG